MKLAFAFACGFALCAGLPARAAEAAASPGVVEKAIDGFIRPGYAAFRDKTGVLAGAAAALCKSPSADALAAARQDFAATVDAWSAVEVIRFGPVSDDNRLDRVLYWPDRKGAGLRQVQAVLAAADPAATDPAKLAGKSVAVQGLGALEFVLYGKDAETLTGRQGAFRCRYGAAIAANLDGIAAALVAAWAKPDGFAAGWAAPGPADPLYRDDDEALTELVDVFINGLELIRDQRLGGFLAKAGAKEDRPKQALFWRSGLTQRALAANIAGLRTLLSASAFAEALPADDRWLVQSADAQLGNAVATVAGVPGSIAEALADPARRERLVAFQAITSSLSNLFGTRATGALGLSAGFSSLDGD